MTDLHQIRRQLARRLRKAHRDRQLAQFRVVTMSDFSLDRIVNIDGFPGFVRDAGDVLSRGGGLLPRSVQSVQQGGCAANAATTLARMGVGTWFICRTDVLGRHLLEFYLERNGVNIDHVKSDGSLALVTCLEVGAEKRNIMINDQDSFASFGYGDLTGEDLQLLDGADMVGIFDWTLNARGTDLAQGVCSRLAARGVPVFLDTSDPAPRAGEIQELFGKVFTNPGLGYLNLNENELCQFSGVPNKAYSVDEYVELTRSLQERVHPVLDVHTTRFSIDVSAGDTVVPTFAIAPRRATGTGDTWNGGNIVGLLLGCEPSERLMLANAAAAIYGESADARRPTLADVAEFLEDSSRSFNQAASARALG
jgi:sugar/nucleoside kinase (ribokinase family)